MSLEISSLAAGGDKALAPSNQDVGKAVFAGVFGNLLESFDFVVFAYLAAVIGANFFPSSDPIASLLNTYAVFGIGFVARPLGGYFFGRIGDVSGRKIALMATLVLMAVSTFAIGILPTYASIGIAAPILLVAARIAQGLSLGGESMSAVAFIVEWAPKGRRGFVGSFQQFGSGIGLLMGSLMVAILSSTISPEAFKEWGWRIPFLFGVVVGPVGYLIRKKVGETPAFLRATAPGAEQQQATTTSGLIYRAYQAFMFTLFWSVGFYFFLSYMPTFASRHLGVAGPTAIWVNTFMLVVYIAAIPFWGLASDRLGRKPILLLSCIGFTVLSYPLFKFLLAGASIQLYVAIVLLFGILLAAYTGPAPATISEMFPTRNRSKWMSIGYAVSIALSGFTPYVAVWLTSYFDTPLAPIYGVIATALVAALFLLTVQETAKQELG
jgi:MHS family proline/betaine transporter-like MFS transporter